MHEFEKRVFVQESDMVSYFFVIVIFYCASTTAFLCLTGNFRNGVIRLNLDCKMGRCMKQVENHWNAITTNKSVERWNALQETATDCGYVGLQAIVSTAGMSQTSASR